MFKNENNNRVEVLFKQALIVLSFKKQLTTN